MTGETPFSSSKNRISSLRKAELEKFANTLRSKKQFGGNSLSSNSSEVSGVEESWDLVNNLLNQSAPINLGPPRQVGGKRKKKSYSLKGGQESSGATFLPAQWTNPNAPLPKGNNPNQIESAYGRINAVSGMDRNLAAFPNSSMQQTGGNKKDKAKKAKKAAKPCKDSSKEPAKKSKKSASKKSTSLWEKIKSFF